MIRNKNRKTLSVIKNIEKKSDVRSKLLKGDKNIEKSILIDIKNNIKPDKLFNFLMSNKKFYDLCVNKNSYKFEQIMRDNLLSVDHKLILDNCPRIVEQSIKKKEKDENKNNKNMFLFKKSIIFMMDFNIPIKVCMKKYRGYKYDIRSSFIQNIYSNYFTIYIEDTIKINTNTVSLRNTMLYSYNRVNTIEIMKNNLCLILINPQFIEKITSSLSLPHDITGMIVEYYNPVRETS
jgi:hypothetical protein